MYYRLSPFTSAAMLTVSLYPGLTQAEANKPLSGSTEPEIIVTATRTAKTVDDTLAPVTVITRQDIERIQASSVAELLRITPGVSFISNGGFGSSSGISLRGSNTDHVLYLIDGVPVRSATSGTTAIQYLPIAQIERIEIVRGPRSSLYGSDAIGGVVQIFTKTAKKKSASASAGYGSDNTTEFTTSYANGTDNSQFNAGISAFDSDGYDFFGRDSWGVENHYDKDDDGYRNYSLLLNGSHKLAQDLKLSAQLLRSQGRSQFDGYSDTKTDTDFTQQVASGNIDASISDIWQSQLKLSRSYDKQYNELYKPPAKGFYFVDPKTKFNTKTDFISWQNDIIVRDSDILTLGLDYKNDKVDSSTDFSEDSRWNKAFFSQYLYEGEIFDTQIAFRHDDNEAFDTHNTWSIATGFSLDEYVRISTSYGTAFKAPTFNDLYWPADAFFRGNPDLKPEESESFDFGIEITSGNTRWTGNYFNTKVDNLITYVSSYPAVSMMENVARAKIDGIELTVVSEFYGWKFSANASFINPVDRSTGNLLPRRSKRNLNLSLDKSMGALSYGASVLASSKRYNRTDERDELSGYGLLNIRAAWQFNRHWTLKAKVDNLLDKEYVLSQSGDYDYHQPDRFVFTSIHYQM